MARFPAPQPSLLPPVSPQLQHLPLVLPSRRSSLRALLTGVLLTPTSSAAPHNGPRVRPAGREGPHAVREMRVRRPSGQMGGQSSAGRSGSERGIRER